MSWGISGSPWDEDFDSNEPWRAGFMTVATVAAGMVCTTEGGRRFHCESGCPALSTGRDLFGWLCDGGGPVYPLREMTPEQAARAGYTACRVCVPPAAALPATGQTYGHEPVDEPDLWGRPVPVCARCTYRSLRWTSYGRNPRAARVGWPCTSAVVLGLVTVDADRWNARYPVGTPVTAYPDVRPTHPAYDPATALTTVTRTPAWRLGHGTSVVSVDGYPGGICLTHVDPL